MPEVWANGVDGVGAGLGVFRFGQGWPEGLVRRGWALSGEEMRQIDEMFVKHGVDAYPNQGINP